jgi:hypothetical protein
MRSIQVHGKAFKAETGKEPADRNIIEILFLHTCLPIVMRRT